MVKLEVILRIYQDSNVVALHLTKSRMNHLNNDDCIPFDSCQNCPLEGHIYHQNCQKLTSGDFSSGFPQNLNLISSPFQKVTPKLPLVKAWFIVKSANNWKHCDFPEDFCDVPMDFVRIITGLLCFLVLLKSGLVS